SWHCACQTPPASPFTLCYQFFFQAEDGIRDRNVTGVQTCALPIFNDATALVLLRTAVAATAGAFSFWQAAGDFAYAVAVAVLIGAAVGLLAVALRSRIDQPALTTAISFVVPFLAFLPAESAGASGVLAVVAAGLVTG